MSMDCNGRVEGTPDEAMKTEHYVWPKELVAQLEREFARLAQELENHPPPMPSVAVSTLNEPTILAVLFSFFPLHEDSLRLVSKQWNMVFQYKIRERSKSILESMLPLPLASAVEAQIFKHCSYMCGRGAYNNKIKTCYVNLRRNESLRQLLISGYYTPREFVTMKHDDMLLPHEAAYTRTLRAEAIRSSFLRDPPADVQGIFSCSCGCNRQWRRRKIRAGSQDIAKASEVLVCCGCTRVIDTLGALSNRMELHRASKVGVPQPIVTTRRTTSSSQVHGPESSISQSVPSDDRQRVLASDISSKTSRQLRPREAATSQSSNRFVETQSTVSPSRTLGGRISGFKRRLVDSIES